MSKELNKALAEHAEAEAERPEVVARVVHSNPVVLGQCGPLNANDELMTVAQHAASVARWAEMFNRVEQERDAANARLHEVATACATAEQERDAALARVAELESKLAELEKQEPIGCRMSRSALTEAQMRRLYENSTDIENERLGFAAFARLMRRAEAVHQIAAAPSQAQHSVPEGFIGRLSEFLAQRGATGKALLRELRALCAAAPGKEVGHE
ncbi:hypothetical protein JEU36_30195 [Pseudomonas aeruginosa]|nr:hypothetical protein [Pseudomonas aeruginosa]